MVIYVTMFFLLYTKNELIRIIILNMYVLVMDEFAEELQRNQDHACL